MKVNHFSVEDVLALDPIWSAYALADLEPEHQEFCSWSIRGSSLLLIYRGLEPPVLFMQGDAGELSDLLEDIPAGTYQFSCRPEHVGLVNALLQPHSIDVMWRMNYAGSRSFSGQLDHQIHRMDEAHLGEIQRLFGNHSDAPDAFAPIQLQTGIFYGVYDQDDLIAISGTHVRSLRFRLAAIGNVFTHPAYRGNGLASATTGSVVIDLLAEGIKTIVLNVSQSNNPAVKAYERIGFRPHCEYFEGYGKRF